MIGWAPWALSGVLGLAPAAAQTVASDLELGPLRLEMGALGELAEPLALPALLPLAPMLAVSSGTPRRDELDLSTAAEAARLRDARSLFVELRFRLAPYDPASLVEKTRFWKRHDAWGLDEKAQDRATLSFAASRAPGPGLFVAPLFDFDLERLEALTAVDFKGGEHPAKPWGLPRRGDGVWFAAEGLAALPLPPLLPAGDLESGHRVRLSRDRDAFHFDLWPWRRPMKEKSGVDRSFHETERPQPSRPAVIDKELAVVFDSSGVWRGWLSGDYRSEALVSPTQVRDEVLPFSEFQRLTRAAEGRMARALPVVRLRFRPDSAAPYGDEEAAVKERADVGFPLAPRVVYCPRALTPKLVRRLESVELAVGSRTVAARFAGVPAQALAGYLVVPEADLETLPEGRTPEDGELALSVETRAADAGLQVWVYPDRLEGLATGYDGERRRKPRFLDGAGGLAADLAGSPYGLMVEEVRTESVVERDRWRKPAPLVRLHPLAELSRTFAKPEEAVDPRLQPLDALGGKRRPWLGVETQDLNPDLAKLLDVGGLTKGGSLGQLVNEVLPGSPAARAGMLPGDLLLRLRPAGKRQDALIPAKARPVYVRAANEAAWFFRRLSTGLDDALADLVPGTALRVAYGRAGEERTADLVLEASPPDVESSPKWIDSATGLSLKELTADVRRLLRLDEQFQGLLIYDVDPGSPAQVAGLKPFGLLVEFDGRPLPGLAELRSALAAKRAEKTSAVRVRTVYLGRPRYADLRVAAAAPAPESPR